jgi:hypothetical protein
VFIDTSDALNLMAFDAATRDIRWQFFTGGWTWAQPMIDDNTVYIGAISAFPYYFEGIDLERGFFAVDATTGQQKWCVDLPAVKGYVTEGAFATSAVARGVVYVASLDGTIHAIRQ